MGGISCEHVSIEGLMGNPSFWLICRIPSFSPEHPAFLALFRNNKNRNNFSCTESFCSNKLCENVSDSVT